MLYPKFLKNNDTIGITALSSGMGNDIKEVKIALNNLKKWFHLIITPNVYGNHPLSSDVSTRIKELNELIEEDIKMLLNIRGGDFLYECLPFIDYDKIVNKNIWVEGYSDITSLLYILTTKYDLATIYGFNAKSFDNNKLEDYQINNLEIVKGNLMTQKSFLDRNTISINGNFLDKGILIGGCLDVLRFIPGTSFDNTISFINKYKDYGIVWYFDIFAMDSIETYLTLLQMDNMNWFNYTKTIIIGSIYFPKIECNLEYANAFMKVFKNKNIIIDANIGHVNPVFTLINGSLATIKYEDNKMSLDMEFLNENNG